MNMSYCEFHNTGIGVSDCIDILQDWDTTISGEEIKKGKQMFRDFLSYCLEVGIIDSYEEDMIEEIFDKKKEKEDD